MEIQTTEVELNAARLLLARVILEQRAATEELRASNRELETILKEVLASKPERPIGDLDQPADPPVEPVSDASIEQLSLADLKADADRMVQSGREAIIESSRLRTRSQQLRAALNARTDGHPQNQPGLSKREREVLHLMVAGRSSKEIAKELGISFKTAVTHRASIMGKMNVHEVASVVREAIKLGLV